MKRGKGEETFFLFRARTIDEFNGRMETRFKGEPNILYTQQSNIHRFGRSTREDTRLWAAPLSLSVETKAWKLLSRPILAIVNRNEINDHGTLGFSSSFPSITPRGPIPSQPIKSIT